MLSSEKEEILSFSSQSSGRKLPILFPSNGLQFPSSGSSPRTNIDSPQAVSTVEIRNLSAR